MQADVRAFLLTAPFRLHEGDLFDVPLEAPVGGGRRIDVECGTTVFEIKRDLRVGNVRATAIDQLSGYVEDRQRQMDRRYVGVLTDGVEWRCYYLAESGLSEVSLFLLRKEDPDLEALVVWLEGVLATDEDIRPVPKEIETRLGAGSSSHALDQATLRDLYSSHKDDPSVRMKRALWARLLTTALGSQFEDSDELFVEHTLLVNTAEIIAHAVLGLDIRTLAPASLLTGSQFLQHGIHGVVEPDFFDWVVEVPRGDVFVRTLARRLSRFVWTAVRHDVLKILYESVIRPEARKKLGEYYTPDWLAEAMVEKVVTDPLEQRVLDPSCGSGTFVFHAVRRFLEAADAEGMTSAKALERVAHHVLGMDLHPVAVTLARVTYVLAIGQGRLQDPERGAIHVPIFLGDSMQWQKNELELLTQGNLVVQVEDEASLLPVELRFPKSLVDDARRFDQLVEELAEKATGRKPGTPAPSLESIFQRYDVPEEARATLRATFRAMCDLYDRGRNHIWGYYVRNLARPVWLAQPENRVDTLIGNPPWLAYRHMTSELQKRFREMSEARGLWQGAKVATHQDLSGLFVTRVIQLYLHQGGRFGFVMPNAVLDRAQFVGFRKGDHPDRRERVRISFDTPWDLRRLRPHFFPRGSSVVFGERVSEYSKSMPVEVKVWKGDLRGNDSSWAQVRTRIERTHGNVVPIDEDVESPYRKRFRQGASIVPRVLFIVEDQPPGPLGLARGEAAVRSVRSAYEKPPWKDLPPLAGVVPSEFVFPVYFGEHIIPYRCLEPTKGVIPWERRRLLVNGSTRLENYPKLAKWWAHTSQIWLENRSSNRLTLEEQLDYHGKLSAQYPIAPRRVVYVKAGMHLCAAILRDDRAVVDHTLYWAAVSSEDEAYFLMGILNAGETTRLVRPLMSYGKDERHIDKYVWRLPIPKFNPEDPSHGTLVELSKRMEKRVRDLELDQQKNFVSQRRRLRSHLQEDPVGREIEELVVELLS